MRDIAFTFSDGEVVRYTHSRPVEYAFRIKFRNTGERLRPIGYSTTYHNASRAVVQSLRQIEDCEAHGWLIFWPPAPSRLQLASALFQAQALGFTGSSDSLRSWVKDHNETVIDLRWRLCDIDIVRRDQETQPC